MKEISSALSFFVHVKIIEVMTFEEALPQFLNSLQLEQGASPHTRQAYASDLGQLLQFLISSRTSPPLLTELTSQDLEDFIDALQKQKLSKRSLARKLSSLRKFFHFCQEEWGLSDNPMDPIQSPRLASALPAELSQEQLLTLLQAAKKGLPYKDQNTEALIQRDFSMLLLIYATGLRVSELLSLQLSQVDLSFGKLQVKGKGSKERLLPFSHAAREQLEIYVQNYRPLLKPESNQLFVNRRGQKLSRQAFWKWLKQLAVQAGITEKISPHTLRHSFATHLLRSGMNLRSLQMLLGHASLSSTQIYTHMSPQHLKETHRKYHPRGE